MVVATSASRLAFRAVNAYPALTDVNLFVRPDCRDNGEHLKLWLWHTLLDSFLVYQASSAATFPSP